MSSSITAIVKPTHECNLACKYCYIDAAAEQGRMDAQTLEKMIMQLARLPGKERVHIIWHGGEPLLMGTEFYEEAVRMQKFYGKDRRFENGMQSNATLINDGVLEFCEKCGFDIGSSLDGPEEIHNLTRIYPGGNGSFKDVWKGLQKIKQRNAELIKKANGKRSNHLGGGAIVILNRLNIGKISEIYDFFKSQNMSPKINPLIKSGRAAENYGDLGIGPAEYGKALVRIFDRWFYETERGIDVDPLSTILGNLMTGKPVSCNFGESCRKSFISVGPNGDVYPCGRFDGVKDYWLGNLNRTELTALIDSPKHQTMMERNAPKSKACGSCSYAKICNGGCMHNAYMQKGDINDTDYYCTSYRILFKHLDRALRKELDKAAVSPEESERYKQITAAQQKPASEACAIK